MKNDNKNLKQSTPPIIQSTPSTSPFQKAILLLKYLMLFIFGDTGVGKTLLALQFYKSVVIDLEGGTDLYSDSHEFDVYHTTTADEVMAALDWLLTHEHDYCTLVIDPVTVYWEALIKKYSEIFLRRNKGSKGYKFEYYDFQPRDWMTIKAELKTFLRKLIALDMNVIVTARQKIQYADGAFMRAIGETFDAEKSMPYIFDIVLHLFRDEKGRFMARCLKDRSNKLPQGEFECSYGLFEQLYGDDILKRKARPVLPASEQQKLQITHYIEQFGIAPDKVIQRLASYGAECLDDLTEDNAKIILSNFESTLEANLEKPVFEKE